MKNTEHKIDMSAFKTKNFLGGVDDPIYELTRLLYEKIHIKNVFDQPIIGSIVSKVKFVLTEDYLDYPSEDIIILLDSMTEQLILLQDKMKNDGILGLPLFLHMIADSVIKI